MRHIKTLAVIAVLVFFSPFAKAEELPVLVELIKARTDSPDEKPKDYFTGTLQDPLKVKITGNVVLDLTDVLVLTFTPDAEGEGVKIRAVTLYSPPIYDGYLDGKVEFTIKKDATSAAGKKTPPQTVHPKEIKAIYFLPRPPSMAPAKAGTAATSRDGGGVGGDVWVTVSKTLGGLRQERQLLSEEMFHLSKQHEMGQLEGNPQPTLDALQDSIRIKDRMIEQYQIQLAYLARPRPLMLAESPDASAKGPGHQLYIMDGAHYAQVNDFGNGDYMSSSRYAKVAPGMKLTVYSDGYWKLEYRMLTLAGPAQANWEVKIRFQDDFGIAREIPLQTFLRRVYQTKDTDKTIQDIWHSGTHLAIRDHFTNICTTGCLLRKGHIQFETDNDLSGEDVAK